MKIGVVGKGGTGKTTVAALLAGRYADRGLRVVAVDTDSNPNLGLSLGLEMEENEAVPVLPRSLIIGAGGDVTAADLIEKYGRMTPAGVLLLSAIRVTEAGAGCTCQGHATVRSLLGETLTHQADVTVVDMEAGVEHLSRSGGTLAFVDMLLVVMEPTRKSAITATRTRVLAEDLGIPHVYAVGNKARQPDDDDFFAGLCSEYDIPLAGVLPYVTEVRDADRTGASLGQAADGALRDRLDEIAGIVDGLLDTRGVTPDADLHAPHRASGSRGQAYP